MTRNHSNHNARRTSESGARTDVVPARHDVNDLSMIADWRRIPFLMVDSSQTKLHEDAVAAKHLTQKIDWSADLKMIHPLPLEGPVSLKQGEEQVCLGIRSEVNSQGTRDPFISLVMARNLTKLTDLQARAFLDNRQRDVRTIGGEEMADPNRVGRLKAQLKLVRATALQISAWKNRPLTADHSMAILATHAQTVAIRASRRLRECPSLVVLRHEGSRILTDAESRRRGVDFSTKTGSIAVAVGKAVPTLLRGGEPAGQHDSLRLKERGNSGAINITQITCALLGIKPIPEELVREGLRPDSELDRWKNGGPLPDALSAAIKERRNAIREALSQLPKA